MPDTPIPHRRPDNATEKRIPSKPEKLHPYPLWSPRFWHGMRFGDWVQLLVENRFRVHPLRWVMVILISLITPIVSVLVRIQQWRYGRRIEATPIEQPPLFIIGHWRSGTTFLHELMVLDDSFTFPTTYQCFAPLHFLVSEWCLARFLGLLLPRRRPMDNMLAGWQRPQEDEFALMTMGVRTPYRRMAFPNNSPVDLDYLNFQGLSADELKVWEAALQQFVRILTFRQPKRVILKSPTHTGRIAHLARIFPGAQFIHISRDPFDLFPSTRRLWQSLDAAQGCQVPRDEQLDEFVFDAFRRMYDGLDAQRSSVDSSQIVDIRYEDLVADPVGVLESVYEQLDLGDFTLVREKLETYVDSLKDYQTNRHELEPEIRAEIERRWGDYFQRFGYSTEA